MGKLDNAKSNLNRIPVKQKRAILFLIVPIAIVAWVLFSGGEDAVDTNTPTNSPTAPLAQLDTVTIKGGDNLSEITAEQRNKKILTESISEKEAIELKEGNNASAFLSAPNLKLEEKNTLGFINTPVQEIELIDPFSTAKSLPHTAPKDKYAPLLTSSILTTEQPNKLYAQDLSVVNSEQAQKEREEREAKQAKHDAEVAMKFQYLMTISAKQNLSNLNSTWIATASNNNVGNVNNRANNTRVNTRPNNSTTAPPSGLTKDESNTFHDPSVDRTKIAQPVLLPGDRILTKVKGNVNSDYNSIVVLEVVHGALKGAEIICSFKVGGRERDQPMVTSTSITWRGNSSPIKGFLTEPTKNNNYVTADVDYHTISRWSALASSFLIKGYSEMAVQSGIKTIYDPVTGKTTREFPKYTEEGLLLGATSELANKASGIASQYFGRAPTVKLNDGDVFGLLITVPFEMEWLPPIKKGRDVL